MPIIPSEELHSSELGEQHYKVSKLPPATQPPQFVGFLCYACGERHADLVTLTDCFEAKRKMFASAAMLQLVTA